ncbi:MAG: hypothetical protein WC824_15860 [Bacteroidota bacterium]|jgi:hypothetical protein
MPNQGALVDPMHLMTSASCKLVTFLIRAGDYYSLQLAGCLDLIDGDQFLGWLVKECPARNAYAEELMGNLHDVKKLEEKLHGRMIGDDVQLGYLPQDWLNKFKAIGNLYLTQLQTSLATYANEGACIPDVSKELGQKYKDFRVLMQEGLFENTQPVDLLLPDSTNPPS